MDKSYLEYPKRAYGQDHDFYNWRQTKDRPKLKWDKGVKVAINLIIPLEFFPLNPSAIPFKHPGAMITPYPDLRHFTVRDYGNRVGVFRILEALNDAGVKAGFAVNGEIAKRYPMLVEMIQDQGHEIIAHGMSTDHIHHEGMSAAEETKLIQDTLANFDTPPLGWMSPARGHSSRTLDLLADVGLKYCLDWEPENAPVATKDGFTLIPNSYELSDFTLLYMRRQTEESWLKQIQNAISYLSDEHSRFGAQSLGLTLTPYIMGQPFRIWALRALLSHIANLSNEDVLTAHQIDQQFRAQA